MDSIQTKEYFLSDIPSVTQEFFDSQVADIFVETEDEVRLEVRCPASENLSSYTKNEQGSAQQENSSIDIQPPEQSIFSSDSTVKELQTIKLDAAKLEQFLRVTAQLNRIFYIRQVNSCSPLEITKQQYDLFAKTTHVFPQLQELLINFKDYNYDTEISPPRIRYRSLNCQSNFECGYVLRFIERTNRIKEFPWVLRQYVVYHKYNDNAEAPHSTWAFLDFLSPNPFGLYINLLETAIASWRPYLIHENERLQDLASRMDVRLYVIENHGLNYKTTFGGEYETNRSTQTYPFSIDHYQMLTNVEREASEVLLCLDSTLDTVTSLTAMYGRMKSKLGSVGTEAGDEILFSLEEREKDVNYTRKKAQTLLFKARSMREESLSLEIHLSKNGHANYPEELSESSAQVKKNNNIAEPAQQEDLVVNPNLYERFLNYFLF